MRKRALISAALIYAAMTFEALAQGTPPACTGTDLLAQLRTDDPSAYKTFEAETARVPNAEGAEGLLWRIEKAGVKPSFLFGTIHITDPRVTDFPAEIREAFAQSTTVALELAGTGDFKASVELSKLAFARGRKTSADAPLENLTPDERQKVVAALKARGLPGKSIDALKPWFLAMSLSMPACEMARQGAAIEMVDAKIANMARGQQIPIIGLETDVEQIDALTSLEPWVYEAMLRDGSRSEARNQDMMELMVRLYVDRKIGGMVPAYRQLILPEENMDAFKVFVTTLLGERNLTMRDRARPLIEKGGVFIAVGALHLPDESGLVELIRQDGYTVTRVW